MYLWPGETKEHLCELALIRCCVIDFEPTASIPLVRYPRRTSFASKRFLAEFLGRHHFFACSLVRIIQTFAFCLINKKAILENTKPTYIQHNDHLSQSRDSTFFCSLSTGFREQAIECCCREIEILPRSKSVPFWRLGLVATNAHKNSACARTLTYPLAVRDMTRSSRRAKEYDVFFLAPLLLFG